MTLEYEPKYRRNDYEFTTNWFIQAFPAWPDVLRPLKGKPNLRYLEIGVYEGRSAIWMIENVLTHPTSRLTAIDIFPWPEVKARYLSNLRKSGAARRATTIHGSSRVELRKLPFESFDIIYIDGSHTADDVLGDAVLSWDLLKDGGLLIFDDYAWTGDRENLASDELRPGVAIDSFLTAYRNYVEIVYRGYQMIVRKSAHHCPDKHACSVIGAYEYDWGKGNLYRSQTHERVDLSSSDRALIEQILLSRKLGQFVPAADNPVRQRPDFGPVLKRLGIEM